MRLYCDMNIYNRAFDEQDQLRIRLETAAIEAIFALAETGVVTLAWSFMLDYENSLNPYSDRKEWAELLSTLCKDKIVPSSKVLTTARAFMKSAKVKPRDAIHLASAEVGDCDYFVTCDDDLIRLVQRTRIRPKLRLQAINPVEFIRKEGKKYGQS